LCFSHFLLPTHYLPPLIFASLAIHRSPLLLPSALATTLPAGRVFSVAAKAAWVD